MNMKLNYFALLTVALAAASCTQNSISYQECDGYTLVLQTKGPTLGYSPDSGVQILTVDGYAFKDLNRNGELDPYEDWRLASAERAADLSSKLETEKLTGLMLYSSAIDVNEDTLSQKTISSLQKNNLRHMLIRTVKDPRTSAAWSNSLQAFCEREPWGIPANNSTDPRNYPNGSATTGAYKHEPDGEYDPDGRSNISKWPREVGLAATFDMDVVRTHGEVVSAEYRALGITTALSPQTDLSTEPRWRRFYATFTEDPALSRDIVREYCDAFQTTEGSRTGWGAQSVNCMVKHWPGGGTGEGGRDAHFSTGKFGVYPGGNFRGQLTPFVEGAFKLKGKTAKASAVMPYYTIAVGQDPSGKNVGNGFSRYIIGDLLRGEYAYDGVVCTDWGIVGTYKYVYDHKGKPWGVETLGPAEKRLLCFEAGVDQLGGVSSNEFNLEAYRMWEEKYGAESARERFELSARRLLKNIFNVGLFENPYVDPAYAESTVGCEKFVAEGYDAMLKSIVMLKNKALPVEGRLKVYEPLRQVSGGLTHWQKPIEPYDEYPISKEMLGAYYDVVETPEEADFAIVSIKSPIGHWGYIMPNDEYPNGHYQPISLQYRPYPASNARAQSIGFGDPAEEGNNRSYRGRTETTSNEFDLETVIRTKEQMGGKPVIVVVATDRPFVAAEIEPYADAILLTFGVDNKAVMDIVSGRFEPYGLLPFQMPADMETVEAQCEDLPHDMVCYKDSEGNEYDFAFGLNWKGRINDSRTKKYGKK